MLSNTSILELNINFPHNPIGFLDIETTGLCKHSDHIIAIGLVHKDGQQLVLTQWIGESIIDEKIIINNLLSKLSSLDKLYTYGGTHFDYAFIAAKAAQYDLDLTSFQRLSHIDFKKLPSFKYLSQWIPLKRSSLDLLLSCSRTLTITGRELAKVAILQTTGPSSTYADLIRLHNLEELYSLINYFGLHQLLQGINLTALIHTESNPSSIQYTFKCAKYLSHPLYIETLEFTFNYNPEAPHIELVVLPTYQELKRYLPYKDYYFVNGELLHHSLASFLPASLKVKAKKELCILTKKALFLPSSSATSDEIWVDDNKNNYIVYQPSCDLQSPIHYFHKKITRG